MCYSLSLQHLIAIQLLFSSINNNKIFSTYKNVSIHFGRLGYRLFFSLYFFLLFSRHELRLKSCTMGSKAFDFWWRIQILSEILVNPYFISLSFRQRMAEKYAKMHKSIKKNELQMILHFGDYVPFHDVSPLFTVKPHIKSIKRHKKERGEEKKN